MNVSERKSENRNEREFNCLGEIEIASDDSSDCRCKPTKNLPWSHSNAIGLALTLILLVTS